MFELKKAVRQKAKLRIGLAGPSYSGKTFSALRLAAGLAPWDKIALIDTERGSGELYAHLGEYFTISLEPPFSPERYIQAIKVCEQAGMEVIIIDSASHVWTGEGGCLEINEKIAQTKFRGNTWSAWSVTTPRYEKFINAILQSSSHVITCNRSKTETIMTEEKKVKKVGLKQIQRENFEYELTVSFDLDKESHLAMIDKDRTELFVKADPFLITEDTGKALLEWCNSGSEPVKQEKTIEEKVYQAEKPTPEVVYPTPEQVARFTEVFAAYGTQEKMSADAVKAAKKKMFNGKKIKDTPVETVLKYTRMMENKLQSNTN